MGLCKLLRESKKKSYEVFIHKQNKLYAKKFANTPFCKRLVFVPHCMRNTSVCTATEKDGCYICVKCDSCKISYINKLVKKLNYKALYIVKGGRIVEKIIKEQKPKAILGLACFFEGYQAFKMLEEKKIIMQFVPLTKDGCSFTDIDLTKVENVLNYIE
ncbi:MAG: DUF116 domain-containing protein [Endomicrobium sp.]|jgi:hypothetical protein|nr:DUF116 domain-containing protein [Endomicrobium sp.]